MKISLHKNAFKFILAGTIALTPLAGNLAVTTNTAYAAGTTDIVSYHEGIYKKLTASDIADIKTAYGNVAKVNFTSILGNDLVNKIDGKTKKAGTAAKLAADLARLQYTTNATEFKTALADFKKNHDAEFTKIFDGKLSVDQAVSMFAAFEKNLEAQLVTSFVKNDHLSFDKIINAAKDTTLSQNEFKGFDGLFSQKLGVSVSDLLTMRTKAEAVADPNKSASAALSSGLIRSRGGDISGASTVTVGAAAPTYSFKVLILGDFTKNVVWKTTNSDIAVFSGNKLVAKKAGKVKVQAYYLNMPIITKEVTIVKDTVAPAMPTVNSFSNKDVVIQGKAEANSFITVKNGKTTVASGTTSSKGTFALKIKAQTAGTTLTITAKDAAGNVSKARTIKVADKIAPSTPTVSTVDDNDKVIKGKAEKSSYITVKSGKTVVASGKTSSKGTFTLSMKKQKANTILTVTAKDTAGNVSKARTVKVIDKTAPAKPTVYAINSKTKVVKGKAEAGSTITISNGKKVLATGKVSSKGNFSVKIRAQKKGTVLYISAKDKANNKSSSTKVTVKAAK
ncbi:Ig-like domain-containing protein [Neobacillus soli]|uniref:Ig-like domain-containing protein n=1 Tax=Neobacillus soli TaxID=220688 RepID=UPI000826E6C5|nr:Ig-like domain-containing protein [Neobacillus soli]